VHRQIVGVQDASFEIRSGEIFVIMACPVRESRR